MKNAEQIVNELKSIDGCLGAVLTRGSECMVSCLPSVVDRGRLGRVAATIHKLSLTAAKAGYPESDVCVRYANAALFIFPLGAGGYVALLCRPDVSGAAVKIFAGVAVDELRHLQSDAQGLDAGPTGDLDAFCRNHAGRLDALRKIFVSHVGPIGKRLFDKHLRQWAAEEGADWARIERFRSAIAAEIEDSDGRYELVSSKYWGSGKGNAPTRSTR
ncbi:MAG TPA: hypothetical protein ENJ37_10375 [Deltaproteobacteria bacterium]|nr:hypothetical protein [Deltaproteobacteria bacterium]